MKTFKKLFLIIVIFISSIFAACKNFVEMEASENKDIAIVKFFASEQNKNVRTIFPDLSNHTQEQLTHIKITVDEEKVLYWKNFEDCKNDDSVIISTGLHVFKVKAWIRNVEYEGEQETFINPGTNYINFELVPDNYELLTGLDDSDPSYEQGVCHALGGHRERGYIDLTVYFPPMEGNLKAKIYRSDPPTTTGYTISENVRRRMPYDIVSNISVCNDKTSPYYNMMYFNYSSAWTIRDIDYGYLKIIVEDENNGKDEAAYYTDGVLIAIGCTSRKVIVIPSLVSVHHATYYDGAVDKNGNPHVYLKETFLYGSGYSVLPLNCWYKDMECTNLISTWADGYIAGKNIKNDLSFYRKTWENKEVVKVSFVTNCDKKMEPVYVPKGSFKYPKNLNVDGSEKSALESDNSSSERLYTYIYNLDDYMYGFAGWYYDEDCTQNAHEAITISNDITLYAKWEDTTPCFISFVTNCDKTEAPIKISKTAKVSFNLDDPRNIEIRRYSAGTTFDYDRLVTEITKEGYTFGGWYFDSGFTQPAQSFTPSSDKVTLYAKWIKD